MSGAERPTSLILHPITHDVYRVPREAIRNDHNHPVTVPRDAFEEMARLGCVSVTKFLQVGGTPTATFTVEQVLTVRLKGESDEAPMYAWASRMCTPVVDDASSTIGSHATMGQEFLWLWPPGKAWNAWITRQECQRLNPEEVVWGIDRCEPSLRYMTRHPGLMLGPDDIDGCVRVPLEALTTAQRFFVACIKPQQTLFARRSTAQDWTERVTRMTDETQERFDCGAYKRQRLGRSGADLDSHANANANTSTPIKRRVRARASESEERDLWTGTHKRPCSAIARPAYARAKAASLRLARHLAASSPEEARAMALEHAGWVATWAARRDAADRAGRNARWAGLPQELLVTILCMRLDADLEGEVNTTATTLCSLRLVSRDVRAIVDRFVGAQLATLVDEFRGRVLVVPSSPRAPPGQAERVSLWSLCARLRRVGLEPNDALRLAVAGTRTAPGPSRFALASLPPCPDRIPDWRVYLRRRKLREARADARVVATTPFRAPSGDFADLYASMRATNPKVNRLRFVDAASGHARLPNPAYDAALRAAHGGPQDAPSRAGVW